MSKSAIGYYGLALPARSIWQGFFIAPVPAENIEHVLRSAREMKKDLSAKVITPFKYVDDQPLLGSLTATLATIAMSPEFGMDERLQRMNLLANVIMRISGEKYFLIVETHADDAGSATQFIKLADDTKSIDEVRAELRSRPEIMQIEMAIAMKSLSAKRTVN